MNCIAKGGGILRRAIIQGVAAVLVVAGFAGIAPPVSADSMNGTLQVGSRGAGVSELQSRLGFDGYYHGPVNGQYTWQTYWAVRDFQYAFGMPIDGIAGPRTQAMLRRATVRWPGAANSAVPRNNSQAVPVRASTGAWTPPSSAGQGSSGSSGSPGPAAVPSGGLGGFSANDINLMAHVVYGEARNQPFIGQVAVADVILNRYHSSLFPHSIPAIIYQPGAFTSISNGQAWLGLHSQNVQAVLDAIHGWNPVQGALYYWNPATATSGWVWSQPVIMTIGNHVFAR